MRLVFFTSVAPFGKHSRESTRFLLSYGQKLLTSRVFVGGIDVMFKVMAHYVLLALTVFSALVYWGLTHGGGYLNHSVDAGFRK